MTLLCEPLDVAFRAPSLTGALTSAGPLGALLLVTLDPEATAPGALDAAVTAVIRETRAGDWVGRPSPTELAVVLTARAADLDAVADRVLSVVERATGLAAAAGICRFLPELAADEHLRRARLGLDVAWSCGGSRAVRHP